MWLDEKDRCRAPTPGARAWLTFDAAAQGEFLGDANQNLEPTRLGGSRQPERQRWMETLKMQKRRGLQGPPPLVVSREGIEPSTY